MRDRPLADLLYRQTELEELCGERPLEWGEYAHMNAFHGNAALMKEYAGLDPEEPLPAAVEHAIPYDLNKPYSYDLESGLKTFWAVNESSGGAYSRGGMPRVEVIGATHLYAMELFHRRHPHLPEATRSGTLAFPDKSTLLKDTDFDRASWASRLAALPDEFQPVVVCIYWRDYLRGKHVPFLEARLPVVTCGHLLERDFALRLHDLCRRFRYSCANDIAGSFALSILSGCRFFHLPGGPLTETKCGDALHLDSDPSLALHDKQACLKAAPYPPGDGRAQQSLTDALAGKKHLQSPVRIGILANEARAHLRSHSSPGKLVFGPALPRTPFYAFTPRNIDYDGWSHLRSRLNVPAESGIGRVVLKVNPLENKKFTIRRNGRKYNVFTRKRQMKRIVLSCWPGTDTEFEFEGSSELLLPGDTRVRCFRIAELEAQACGVLKKWGAGLGAKVAKKLGLARPKKQC